VALRTLRLLQFRAAYNLPVHVARERGIFARHGLEVEFAYTPGSLYLMDALAAGRFEIGHAAADDLVARVEAKDRASDLFLFMGIYRGLISLVGSPRHASLESLRGQRLAVDAGESGFVLLLVRKLRALGFPPGDYELVEVGGWEKRYAALREGKFAATLLTPPFVAEALESGCHLLLRPGDLAPVYQATCGIASRRWAKENEEALIGYIRAYVEATRWCFDPTARAACVELLAEHTGIGRASAEKALAEILDPNGGIDPDAALSLEGVAAVLELRAELGYLAPPLPPPEKYVDLSYYRRALGETAREL
jgi:ABC-type nitrate/sulfonate/bicarbonate transport system substrate-binding protein